MRRPHQLALVLLLSAPLAGCDDTTAPVGDVRIETSSESIRIVNRSADSPLYSFVVDADQAPLVDWAPCGRPECGQVLPGEARVVTPAEIGSGPGQLVHIYYWRYGYGPADEPVLTGMVHEQVRFVDVTFLP